MKEKCNKCGGDLEPIVVTELDQTVKEHRICTHCKIVYKEKEQKRTEDVLHNMNVRRKSIVWYKIVKWVLIWRGDSPYGPEYGTFMLTVESRLLILRALEIQEKRIIALEAKAGIYRGK